eukprot:7023463-Pyramimonas_sp.AAC.1
MTRSGPGNSYTTLSLLLRWPAIPGGARKFANPHQSIFAFPSVVCGTRDQLFHVPPTVNKKIVTGK